MVVADRIVGSVPFDFRQSHYVARLFDLDLLAIKMP